jgi:putative hemolysin
MTSLVIFLCLLALTAYFNLAEMALVAARESNLDKTTNVKAAQAVLELKKRPGLFLAAIRFGDLVTDLLIGAYVVTWLETLIDAELAYMPALAAYAPAVAGISAFAIISYIVLVFADLVPKSIALSAPERAALLIAAPLRVFIMLAQPIFKLLETSNSFVLKLIHVKPQSEITVTEEEIRRTLSEGLSAGVLLSYERSMMERVLNLDHRPVRSVMTPRRHIQFLRADSNPEQVKHAVLEASASRLLVAADASFDQVHGIVSRANILAAITRNEEFDLTAMATAPVYVAESTSTLNVLEVLKRSTDHMVVIVDEFGSTVGLATFADVFETVAGDTVIATEACGPFGLLEQESDGSYVISGDRPVDDVAEILSLSVNGERAYKTMAGLVLDHFKRLPRKGEVAELPGCLIEVINVDRGKIESLRLTVVRR